MSDVIDPIVKPVSFKLEGVSQTMYYKSKDLQAYDPVFYYGCKTKPRNILVKKCIPDTEYIYANFNARSNSWVPSTEECKKAVLLLSKTWVEANMAALREEHLVPLNEIKRDSLIDDPNKSVNIFDPTTSNIETIHTVEIHPVGNMYSKPEEPPLTTLTEREYEPAPPRVNLDETEKFRDADGNVLEIETRGRDRREDAVFFRCSDVSRAFDMPSLNKTITRDDRGYEEHIDYKYFKPHRYVNDVSISNKNPFTLFLTYEGLLRVLFVSRSKHAMPFRKWATAVLFTHQMGTKDAKVKLGTDLLNITPKTYKAVFDTYATTFPCIYLLRLATVKEVRSTFGIAPDIADDLVVYKYGFTEDLSRRIKEHSSGYGKMPGVSIRLSTFHVIDPKYTSDAEGDVREFVETFQKRLQVDGHNELVVLTDKEMNFVKKQYASIGSRYAGATAELTAQISELKARIKELENELAAERLKHVNDIQRMEFEKKMVEMQRDTNAELFRLKETNYKLELQLVKQS